MSVTGTGGTIAGIGKYLKSVVPDCRIILADPEGEFDLCSTECFRFELLTSWNRFRTVQQSQV